MERRILYACLVKTVEGCRQVR